MWSSYLRKCTSEFNIDIYIPRLPYVFKLMASADFDCLLYAVCKNGARHTASYQMLEAGKAWKRGYLCICSVYGCLTYLVVQPDAGYATGHPGYATGHPVVQLGAPMHNLYQGTATL